ncbi:uncharacterized protein LOC131888522 [Tigriopus californicus]|uniref:uncharacterized protein LOC131888522 n=1 Tax=Tigriopus californicus TaxID=6832 RepID=UPI0027DA5243|nr:uncharacterized protein LOC131888522 [Tigriopus californicus]
MGRNYVNNQAYPAKKSKSKKNPAPVASYTQNTHQSLNDPLVLMRSIFEIERFNHTRVLNMNKDSDTCLFLNPAQQVEAWKGNLELLVDTTPTAVMYFMELFNRCIFVDQITFQFDPTPYLRTGVRAFNIQEMIKLAHVFVACTNSAPRMDIRQLPSLLILDPCPRYPEIRKNVVDNTVDNESEVDLNQPMDFNSMVPHLFGLLDDQSLIEADFNRMAFFEHEHHLEEMRNRNMEKNDLWSACKCIRAFQCDCALLIRDQLSFSWDIHRLLPPILREIPLYEFRVGTMLYEEKAKLPLRPKSCTKCLLPLKFCKECPCLPMSQVMNKTYAERYLKYSTTQERLESSIPRFINTIEANTTLTMSQLEVFKDLAICDTLFLFKEFAYLLALIKGAPCSVNNGDKIGMSRPFDAVINVRNTFALIMPFFTSFTPFFILDADSCESFRGQFIQDKFERLGVQLSDISAFIAEEVEALTHYFGKWDILEIHANIQRLVFHPWTDTIGLDARDTFEQYQRSFHIRWILCLLWEKTSIMMRTVGKLIAITAMTWSNHPFHTSNIGPVFPSGSGPKVMNQLSDMVEFVKNTSRDLRLLKEQMYYVESTRKTSFFDFDHEHEDLIKVLNDLENSCSFCGLPASQKCQACHIARYCTKKCWKKWCKTHELICDKDWSESFKKFLGLNYEDVMSTTYEGQPESELKAVVAITEVSPRSKRIFETIEEDVILTPKNGLQFLQDLKVTRTINEEMIAACMKQKLHELDHGKPIFMPPHHQHCCMPII